MNHRREVFDVKSFSDCSSCYVVFRLSQIRNELWVDVAIDFSSGSDVILQNCVRPVSTTLMVI